MFDVVFYTLGAVFTLGLLRTLFADIAAERRAKREFQRLYPGSK